MYEKGKRIISITVVLVLLSIFTIYHWNNEAVKTAHILPQIPKMNIETLISKNKLSNQELEKIAEQTGLQPAAIEDLLSQGRGQVLLELQKAYFAPIELVSLRTTPLTICEYVINENGEYAKGTSMVNLQDGDILITKNSRFLGWRNGHAGIVVDAKNGIILEAVMLGTNTRLCSVRDWEKYPSFLVLRLKEEFRDSDSIEEVVTFAEQNLLDIPYMLHAGLWDRITKKQIKAQEETEAQIVEAALSGTQCAHVVWYAYEQIGIDLDSDGGLFVTPYDIQNSPFLEVIQSYGY